MICRLRHSSKTLVLWLAAALTCSGAVAGHSQTTDPFGLQMGRAVSEPGMGLALPDIPVLTIEADRLFAATKFGQSLTRDLEQRGNRLAAENRRIESDLASEEADLTERRAELDAVTFRDLADAFDSKVQKFRAEQDEKARALAVLSDQAQREFLKSIASILEAMMTEQGSSVILDRRAVFLSADVSDITEAAVARIDMEIGEGPTLDEIIKASQETSDGTDQ